MHTINDTTNDHAIDIDIILSTAEAVLEAIHLESENGEHSPEIAGLRDHAYRIFAQANSKHFRPLSRLDFCFAAAESIPAAGWTVETQMSVVDQACNWHDQHGEPLEGETLADCRRRQDEEIDRIDAALRSSVPSIA